MMRVARISLLCLLLSTPAWGSGGFRGWGALGLWSGGFSQEDGRGHDASFPLLTSFALELGVGVSSGFLFIEYTTSWFIPNYILFPNGNGPSSSSSPSHRDGVYYSLVGFNVGARADVFPLEPYVGYEYGHFGLSSGSKTDYTGPVWKLGVNLRVGEMLAIRGEYRRHFMTSDDSGGFPEGISTRGTYWFLGIAAGKF